MELLPELWNLILLQLEPFDRYALMFCCKNLYHVCNRYTEIIVLPQLEVIVNRYKNFGLCRKCKDEILFARAKCSCTKQENRDTFQAILQAMEITNNWPLLIKLWNRLLGQYWETTYLSALYTGLAKNMNEKYKQHRNIPTLIRDLKLTYRFACRNRFQCINLDKHLVRYLDIKWTSYINQELVKVARYLPKLVSDVEIISRLENLLF